MANEYTIQQTKKVFEVIVNNLICKGWKFPEGGSGTRIIKNAIEKLENGYGRPSMQRIVDYVVCSAYPFKERKGQWTINQVFGPKSFERFNSDKGRVYYENKWLKSAYINRESLIAMLINKSKHPLAKFIYMPHEERLKDKYHNQEEGYYLCYNMTLGWSPESIACCNCSIASKCERGTAKRFPELYRIRIENYGSKE